MASFFAWVLEERCTSVPTRGGRVSGRAVVPGAGVRGCPGDVFRAGPAVPEAGGREVGLVAWCIMLLQISSNSVPLSRTDVANNASSSLSIALVCGKLSAPSGAVNGLLYRVRFPFRNFEILLRGGVFILGITLIVILLGRRWLQILDMYVPVPPPFFVEDRLSRGRGPFVLLMDR